MDSQQKEVTSTVPEDDQATGWHYNQETAGKDEPNGSSDAAENDAEMLPDTSNETEVRWTASEYVAHHKSFGWYALLFLGAFVMAGLAYFITHDKITMAVIIIVAILLAVIAGRKPRTQDYELERSGLHIGPKFYPYSTFKSFNRVQEGAFSNVTFMPMKRFMPPVSIYYEPKDEEKIIQTLAVYLPLENREHDTLDKFLKKIRF